MNWFIKGGILSASFLITNSVLANETPDPYVLEINNFIGVLEVKTAPNSEFTVKSIPGKKFDIKTIDSGINRIVSLNNIDATNVECKTNFGTRTYKIDGKNFKIEDFPKVIITMPTTNGLRIKNSALDGDISDVAGAALNMKSCGKLKMGNIAHALELDIDGVTSLQTGNIGEYARVKIFGAASLNAGNIRGIADLNIDGAGSLAALSSNGLKAKLAGAGSIQIQGGKGPFDVALDGIGRINYAGTAINPIARIDGIGSVKVKEIIGSKDVKIEGLGKFTVN